MSHSRRPCHQRMFHSLRGMSGKWTSCRCSHRQGTLPCMRRQSRYDGDRASHQAGRTTCSCRQFRSSWRMSSCMQCRCLHCTQEIDQRGTLTCTCWRWSRKRPRLGRPCSSKYCFPSTPRKKRRRFGRHRLRPQTCQSGMHSHTRHCQEILYHLPGRRYSWCCLS